MHDMVLLSVAVCFLLLVGIIQSEDNIKQVAKKEAQISSHFLVTHILQSLLSVTVNERPAGPAPSLKCKHSYYRIYIIKLSDNAQYINPVLRW